MAIPTLQFDVAPSYVVIGGMVFQELTGAYLQEWGDKWSERAPQRLVQLFSFQQEMNLDPAKKIVFLSQILPSSMTMGYLQLSGLVLSKLNGQEIDGLKSLAVLADGAKDGNLVFEFTDNPERIILDAAEVKTLGDKIGKDYGLPALRRL